MPWTVTNSFKRGLMKTYGRPTWRVFDDELRPATKRRRVQSGTGTGNDSDEAESNLEYAIRESSAAILSSPARRNSVIFSEVTHDDDYGDEEEDDDLSTPPSSPPPASVLTPPRVNSRKPTFAFLKRKHSAMKDQMSNGASPLSEVNSNSVRTLAAADPTAKKKAAVTTLQHQNKQPVSVSQPPALKQMQIDLGHEVRKTCATCGMEYIPSNSEDAALHKKFHDMNPTTGVDLGKAFMRANMTRWVYEATRFDEGYVVIVDRKASSTAKSQAKKVLEVVNKELSSPEIDDETLWSQIEPPKSSQSNGSTSTSTSEKVDRYKVFLHMKDSRCVGLCLTERIWESRPVERRPLPAGSSDESKSSSITVKDEIHPAIVGVSRIWTSNASRRKGIAMDLLDCVVSNFIYGMEIPKDQIAFSQPTESGNRLAEAFFGVDEQWHVYNEA